MAKTTKTLPGQLLLIKEILKPEYFPQEQNLLIETNQTGDGISFEMKREIYVDKRENHLLFRFDPDKEKLFPFFETGKGLSKICDYILFVEKKNTLFVLLIELKRGAVSSLQQLKASEGFVDFIIKSGKRVGFNFTDDIRYKKIKISDKSLTRKRKTSETELTTDSNGIINYLDTEFRIKNVLGVD